MKKIVLLATAAVLGVMLLTLVGCSSVPDSELQTNLSLTREAKSWYYGSHRGTNARSAWLWSASMLADDLVAKGLGTPAEREVSFKELKEVDQTFNPDGYGLKPDDYDNFKIVHEALHPTRPTFDTGDAQKVEAAARDCGISSFLAMNLDGTTDVGLAEEAVCN